MTWRIELASSPDTSPLFLTRMGDRIAWVPEPALAARFDDDEAAWRFVAMNVRSDCRVSHR